MPRKKKCIIKDYQKVLTREKESDLTNNLCKNDWAPTYLPKAIKIFNITKSDLCKNDWWFRKKKTHLTKADTEKRI